MKRNRSHTHTGDSFLSFMRHHNEPAIIRCARAASSREAFWSSLIRETDIRSMAEVGVWRGAFAECLLRDCPEITRYVMIDPWQHLADWEKPCNVVDSVFEEIYAEAMRRTRFAEARREVLRHTTREAAAQLADGSLDFVYVDGDHTLRGITIDLISTFAKVKPGGFLGGDDFTPSIWQHDPHHEPTLVCPLAVHFAEAVNCPIYALPHGQFLIVKDPAAGFDFIRMAPGYESLSLRRQFATPPSMKQKTGTRFPALAKLARRLKWGA